MSNIKTMAENILMEIGANPANRGFAYMICAMETIEEKSQFQYETTNLYKEIAKRQNTTVSKVERAIRSEKEEIMTHGDMENFEKYFPAMQEKLPNGKFLAVLYLRLCQMKGDNSNAG